MNTQLNANYEEITFIAGSAVIDAADQAFTALELFAAHEPEDGRLSYYDDVERAKRSFINAARAELGITKPERKYSVSSDTLRELLKNVVQLLVSGVFPFR